MASENLNELSINVYHTKLKNHKITVEAIVRHYLDRIERYDQSGPKLNAVLTVNDEAIDRAKMLDKKFHNDGIDAPLFGVPVLIKDQAKTAGLRTTFGSVAFADFVPTENATVVDRLEKAGAIVLAKTNLPDFAAGFVGYSSVGGQTLNPYDITRDSGGSSAGTGAGIAADFGLVGIGEDTGGSIRVPASFCNLFGLRVTTGLVSRSGMSPLVAEQDTPGPMCRTVDDLARLLDVILGFDTEDETTAIHAKWMAEKNFVNAVEDFDLESARIGVLRDAFGDSDNPRVEPVNTIINDALIDLRTAGATLVDPINIAGLNKFLDDTSLYGLVAKRDLNDFIETLSEPPVETFEEIYEQGLYHKALEHIETIASAPVDPTVDSEYWFRLARQKAFQQAIMYCLAEKNLDALAFPNVQVVPPMFEGYHTGDLTRADIPTNTLIASQSGCPAVSMPAGFTENGLPIGLELLGAPLSDRKLVGFAAAYEKIANPRKAPALIEN